MDVIGHGAQMRTRPRPRCAPTGDACRPIRGEWNNIRLLIPAQPPSAFSERCAAWNPGLVGTRTDAMGHLIEPVAQASWGDFDRLKHGMSCFGSRAYSILRLCSGDYLGGLAPRGEELVAYSRSNSAGQRPLRQSDVRVRAAGGVRGHRN